MVAARGDALDNLRALAVRVASLRDDLEVLLAERDALIVEARVAGALLTEIGDAVGISHPRVAQIVRRAGLDADD